MRGCQMGEDMLGRGEGREFKELILVLRPLQVQI